jgi:hypothetical protein
MAKRDSAATGRTHQISVWHQMISGMRAYGIAITLIWALSATSLLAVFAVAVSGVWIRVALGGAALVELGLSALTLVLLQRASRSGRFDV